MCVFNLSGVGSKTLVFAKLKQNKKMRKIVIDKLATNSQMRVLKRTKQIIYILIELELMILYGNIDIFVVSFLKFLL